MNDNTSENKRDLKKKLKEWQAKTVECTLACYQLFDPYSGMEVSLPDKSPFLRIEVSSCRKVFS